jgi:uncharacterized spore protein YtfJ
MNFTEILSTIIDKVRKHGGVELSFGNPQTVNNLTIIPVAKVSYGFGMGGGVSGAKSKSGKIGFKFDPKAAKKGFNFDLNTESPAPVAESVEAETEPVDEKSPAAEVTDEKQENSGGGGGGGMKTQPLGIFVINKDTVKFYPVVTVKEVSLAVGFLLLTLWRIFKTKRAK